MPLLCLLWFKKTPSESGNRVYTGNISLKHKAHKAAQSVNGMTIIEHNSWILITFSVVHRSLVKYVVDICLQEFKEIAEKGVII